MSWTKRLLVAVVAGCLSSTTTAFAPVSRRAPLARVSPVGRGSFAPTSRMVKELGVGGDSLSEVKGPGQEEGLALAAKQDRVQSLMVPLVTTTAFALAIMASTNNPAMAAGEMSVAATGSFFDKIVGDGFAQAFSLIFVSEIGDKTFFIAALLSAKFNRLISFTGSVGALVVMTGISVLTGQIFHNVPTALTQGLPIDDYVACAAFAYFGYRTLKESFEIEEDEKGGELLDAEEALAEVGEADEPQFWNLVAQTFSLVFAAEFGDRSFLSTIALAAAQNPLSVALGAVVAHTIATAIAIAGGAILSEYISEKVIGYIGGSLFIVFAVTTAFGFF